MNYVYKIGKMPLKEFCWLCDIDYFKVYRKVLRKGMEPVEAVREVLAGIKGTPSRPVKYELNGEPVRKLLNVNEYNRFRRHIRKGLSVKKAYKLAKEPYSGLWI